jgi:hypothetical protein
MIREVPVGEWPSFLEGFGRQHRAWLATLHGIEQGRPVTRVPSAAIKRVTLETLVPDSVVRFTFLSGVSLCAPRPATIRLQKTQDGADAALEVDTTDGAFIRLAFRATALPEQLDGIAPGELTAQE